MRPALAAHLFIVSVNIGVPLAPHPLRWLLVSCLRDAVEMTLCHQLKKKMQKKGGVAPPVK